MRTEILVLSALMFAGVAFPQDASAPAIPPRTLAIVVHDKHGSPLNSVPKDDLQLVIDSKPVPIVQLESDVARPLLLGVVIDTNRHQEQVLSDEKKPDEAFLDSHLGRPQDKAFVMHYDKQIELMQDLTADHGLLHSAVDDLRPAAASVDDESNISSGDDDDNQARRTSKKDSRLYDAIFLACDEILKKPAGRRVLVVISDGLDHGSKESLSSAVESAQRTGTVVYTVYVEGIQEKTPESNRGNQNGQRRSGGGGGGWPGGGSGGGGWPGGGQSGGGSGGGNGGGSGQRRQTVIHEDGKKILLELSKKTGGAMFEAKKKDDIEPALTQITQALQDEYLLTFQPDPQATGDFHRLSVTANGKDWKVQSPEGYYTHQ